MLGLKAVTYKLYSQVQLMLIPTYYWKNLSIHFVAGLFISINWKSNSFNLALSHHQLVNNLVHYKSIKVTIDALNLAKIIYDIVVGLWFFKFYQQSKLNLHLKMLIAKFLSTLNCMTKLLAIIEYIYIIFKTLAWPHVF